MGFDVWRGLCDQDKNNLSAMIEKNTDWSMVGERVERK